MTVEYKQGLIIYTKIEEGRALNINEAYHYNMCFGQPASINETIESIKARGSHKYVYVATPNSEYAIKNTYIRKGRGEAWEFESATRVEVVSIHA